MLTCLNKCSSLSHVLQRMIWMMTMMKTRVNARANATSIRTSVRHRNLSNRFHTRFVHRKYSLTSHLRHVKFWWRHFRFRHASNVIVAVAPRRNPVLESSVVHGVRGKRRPTVEHLLRLVFWENIFLIDNAHFLLLRLRFTLYRRFLCRFRLVYA